MLLLQIRLSWFCFDVLCILNLFHDLFLLHDFLVANCCLVSFMPSLVEMCVGVVYACACTIACMPFIPHACHCIHKNLHANKCIHSCILVTKTLENEPVEPTESIEPEPMIEFVVQPEENQSKQLSMISYAYFIWFNLVISLEYLYLCIIFMYCIVGT